MLVAVHTTWAGMLQADSISAAGEDLPIVAEMLRGKEVNEPTWLLRQVDGVDRQRHRENITFLNQNKPLLQEIKARLPGPTLYWELTGATQQVLVVPEQRIEYALRFEGYCRQVAAFIIKRLQLRNPYKRIVTLQTVHGIGEDQDIGVTVYLVHHIVDSYREEYLFSSPENNSTVSITLNHSVSGARIGSFASKMMIGENRRIEFVRDNYVIWQSRANVPINLFILPIEETLHILLRDATESAVRSVISAESTDNFGLVEEVAQEWMWVEEGAAVGLMVSLLPEVVGRFIPEEIGNQIGGAVEERARNERYRYLHRGIRLVRDMGLDEALSLYRTEPLRFRDLLIGYDRSIATAM
jgi:hypothetical protein